MVCLCIFHENTMLCLWFHEILTLACFVSLNSDTSRASSSRISAVNMTNDSAQMVLLHSSTRLKDVTNKTLWQNVRFDSWEKVKSLSSKEWSFNFFFNVMYLVAIVELEMVLSDYYCFSPLVLDVFKLNFTSRILNLIPANNFIISQ
jgi:hypothetical protein